MKSESKKIVVIGGKGKEGQRWVEIMTRYGHMVSVVDKGDSLVYVEEAEVVILAIPWRELAAIQHILIQIKPGATCISVMGMMCPPINQSVLDLQAIGCLWIHCMCASHMSLKGNNVIVSTDGLKRCHSWMLDILKAEQAQLHFYHPETHDKMIQFTQSIPRMFAIAFALRMRKEGIELGDLLPFASPPFLAFLGAVARLLRQPAELNECIIQDVGGGDILDLMVQVIESRSNIMFTGIKPLDNDEKDSLPELLKVASLLFDNVMAAIIANEVQEFSRYVMSEIKWD